MGGSAFSQGPEALSTPRMPKGIYEQVKADCYKILREKFADVASPIDGPGKVDFGDVDIFLASPKQGGISNQDMLFGVAASLAATKTIFDNDKYRSAHMAIPWPASPHGAHYLGAEAEQEATQHIQVDLTIFPCVDEMEWMLFKHAHGDFWNILGSIFAMYGLVIDEKALWVRIPEIETKNKKLSKVFLTSHPNKILEFLDLPVQPYYKGPFPDENAMYSYIALSRLFCPRSPEWDSLTANPDKIMTGLNHRGRQKYRNRPIYRKWVQEYLPQCCNDTRFLNQRVTRDSIRKEVFEFFNVKIEFEDRRKEFLLQEQEVAIRRMIKVHLPHLPASNNPKIPLNRYNLREAFRRIIFHGDESYPVAPNDGLRSSDGFYDLKKIESFMEEYKDNEELALVAFSRQQEESEQSIRDAASTSAES